VRATVREGSVAKEPDYALRVTPADEDRLAAWIGSNWAVMHRLAVGLCGPVDGEDVLQDALASAWRKRSQFDPARGPEKPWLLAIVADQARKQRTRQWRRARRESPEDALTGIMVVTKDPSLDLNDAIKQLTDRQRTAIVLHYFVDLPLIEVADVMNCSIGTVKSTLSDARGKLKVHLEVSD
jgi:RNA polymerase sigma factor (sigma-70 family)